MCARPLTARHALALAVLVVSGCSSEGPLVAPPRAVSERDRVLDTAQAWQLAARERDGSAACRLLTPEAGRKLTAFLRRRGARTCSDAFEKALARPSSRGRGAAPRRATLADVRVVREEATEELPDSPDLRLVRRGGRWLVSRVEP